MDIDSLRKLCLGLKGTTEDIKWEHDLCFSIGAKMYCITGFEQPMKMTLKVPAEEFEKRIQTPGIIPAPYLARAKWIMIENVAKFKRQEIEFLILQSYELIKGKLTKKALRDLGLDI